MKNFTLLFLAIQFTSLLANSQNYECVKENAVSHYYSQDSKPVLSVRIDSIKTFSDSIIYYNYTWKRQIENVQFINEASWLGGKIVKLTNNDWLFFNMPLDTIKIKASAILNENWTFYKFSDGSKIKATVTGTDTMSFLGVNDSVKIINLQKVDAVNSNIASIYNDKKIILSKSYGLITVFPFYYFDYQTPDNLYLNYDVDQDSLYQLIGMSNPEIGWQNITARDIYNFNIGDEHHTLREFQCPIPPTGNLTHFEKRKILKYLSKEYSLNNDTVTYSAERCLYDCTSYIDGTTHYTFTHDTIGVQYIFSAENLEGFSYEFICYLYGNASSLIKYKSYITTNLDIFSNCEDSTTYLLYDGGSFTSYYPNLGSYSLINTFPNGDEGESLVYSKVNGVENGTPYSCSALELLAKSLTINQIETINYQIYPNPASDKIIIQFDNSFSNSATFQLYSITGENILSKSINSQNYELDITTLNNGIYFYKINNEENNTSVFGKVIIQK